MFNLHVHFEKPIFFTEAMKTFVDKRRGTASTDETRIVQETIDRYLPDFRNHYQYENRKSLDFNPISFNMRDFPFIPVI